MIDLSNAEVELSDINPIQSNDTANISWLKKTTLGSVEAEF